jgi:glycine oxidase
MAPCTIGIAGAGLLGRLLALALTGQGHSVTLFDVGEPEARQSCGHTGAGMLSPYTELEWAEPEIARLGLQSMTLWPPLLAQLAEPVFFQQAGSLLVSHPADRRDLGRLATRLTTRIGQDLAIAPETVLEPVDGHRIAELEPQLAGRFHTGLFLPAEGQVDNRQLMTALATTLTRRGVIWHWHTPVTQLAPGQIMAGDQGYRFDWVIDTRGLGARPDWAPLRGVRGEIVILRAAEVTLHRPVRLMHPRYPLYIVPRQDQRFVIGATSLESEDFRPMTVQSALELLSAAFSLHPGFAEAEILEFGANCRPALPDNRPQIQVQPGLLRVNGLYRHGFLISPAMVELACQAMSLSARPTPWTDWEQALIQQEDAHAVAH